jgi:acyl-CoA thioesterase FadM
MIAATRPDLAAVQPNIVYKRKLLACDIVEIRNALVEIRDKSIRFQHEMRKLDDYHMSLPRIEPGSINHA